MRLSKCLASFPPNVCLLLVWFRLGWFVTCRKIRRPSTPSLEDYNAITLNVVGRSRRASISEETEEITIMTTSERQKLDRINARLASVSSPDPGAPTFTSHSSVAQSTL